ncbi:MAG TPA: hypothetical protein PK719_09160 [Bacteroidales bacterium]|jgi:hypothetical protein|nr:hypothetical protein [Bacteroidales bacterium]HQG63816.1 hypothetical protein [Bacteroidales bacterium]
MKNNLVPALFGEGQEGGILRLHGDWDLLKTLYSFAQLNNYPAICVTKPQVKRTYNPSNRPAGRLSIIRVRMLRI